MAFIKVRFIGASTRFTTNSIYDVIAVNGENGMVVLDDNNELFGSVNTVGNDFELVSIHVMELKQLYP